MPISEEAADCILQVGKQMLALRSVRSVNGADKPTWMINEIESAVLGGTMEKLQLERRVSRPGR